MNERLSNIQSEPREDFPEIPHPPYERALEMLERIVGDSGAPPGQNDISPPANDSGYLTRMLDNQTIELTKKPESESGLNLSEEMQNLFGDADSANIERDNLRTFAYENLVEDLADVRQSTRFEFFTGGRNQNFANSLEIFRSNPDTAEFIEFLQSDYCKKILKDNDLKIHIESGHIYYDNNDTNESIFDFFHKQNSQLGRYIDHVFTFDCSYAEYFRWINAFDERQKEKLDILSDRNIKYLFYRFNDQLKFNGKNVKKIKHSKISNNYLAAQHIQNNNWQYFVEKILSFGDGGLASAFEIEIADNILILKQTYTKLFEFLEKEFADILRNTPVELSSELIDYFKRKKFELNERTISSLRNWIDFYFKTGRFPGSDDLTILPVSSLPEVIDNSTISISPVELYEKFSNSDARGLVSFQSIVALFLHFGGEHYIAKIAMDEWYNNLLYETLSNQSEKYSLDFEKAIDIIDYLLRAFLTLQSEFDKNESMKKELIDITMDRAGEFDLDEPIQNQMTSTPIKSKKRPKLNESTISAAKRAKIDKTTDSIISKTNIDATKEAKSERKKDVFREILDPAPGLINNFNFTDEDLNKEQDVEKTVEIRNTVKNTIDDIFDKIEKKNKSRR